MTNGEIIRSLSDEEHAVFIADNLAECCNCLLLDECYKKHQDPTLKDCSDMFLSWLKEEGKVCKLKN